MRSSRPPEWVRVLTGASVYEEVFEPAWHEVRAEHFERLSAGSGHGGSLTFRLRVLLLAVQCIGVRWSRIPGSVGGDGILRTLLADARIAVRGLRRRPGFTLVAVLTLGLGIGANAAIFSVVNGVLLRPLPYPDSAELITLEMRSESGFGVSLSLPNQRDWRERARSFTGLGAAAPWSMVRSSTAGATVASVQITVGDFFEVLGVPALVGRTYTAAEADPGAEPVAVLTYGFWQREFGGDVDVLQRTLDLDGRVYAIIGVMPEGFAFPTEEVEVFAPMGVMPTLPWDDRMSSFGALAVARLGPGATVASAQAELDRLTREIAAEDGRPGVTATVYPLGRFFRRDSRTRYTILMGAVAFVLLIAGVNVANLLLARGEERRREIAVRAALGASRWSIVRQVVVESMVLAGGGALLGLALAFGGVSLIRQWLPLPAILDQQVAVDASVLFFTIAIAALVGVAFGLIPGLRLTAATGSTELREGSRGTAPRARQRVRHALVVAETALALVLLVGAGLMLASLAALRDTDVGYSGESVLTARVALPAGQYDSREQWYGFYQSIERRLAAEPGVASAASMLLVPLAPRSWELLLQSEGEVFSVDEGESVLYNIVSPSWFETMRVPILQGRGFDGRDRNDTDLVTVIDETLADRLWPGEDPIGRRITFEWTVDQSGDTVPTWRTVVGIIPNVRHYDMREPSRIQVYVSLTQTLRTWGSSLYVAARTTGDAADFAPRLREIVADVDRDAPLYYVSTLDRYMQDDMADDTALGGLLTVFGAVALGLAAIGVFGVMSLLVASRTREIGVRLAVGARPSHVLAMILSRTLVLSGAGIVIGLLAAGALSGVLASFLYELDPLSPRVYAAGALFLFGVAAVSALVPAMRAARIDPVRTLRHET